MNSNERQVVVLDFPGIKKFVFSSDRLVEIRGASALLDELNREFIPKFIAERFGESRSKCIFAGGGAGQFVIQDSPENIREVFCQIQGEVYKRSGGELRVLTGIAHWKDDYHSALNQAFLNLEKNKSNFPFETQSSLHTGFLRECQSCGGMADRITTYAGEERLLCRACRKKEEAGRGAGLWKEFETFLQEQGIAPDKAENLRPDDFEEIGKRCVARRGYTALVYGDGNAMGRVVKNISDVNQFERFSKAIDSAVREACHEALYRHCTMEDGKIPAAILLLGGDDLMVYLAADTAMPFATEVARLFEEKTRKKLSEGDLDKFFENRLGGKGLTFSLGIAYGKSHTPISIMADQAEELLKSAKKRGSSRAFEKNQAPPACLDFHLTNRFNQVKVADSRNLHLEQQTPKGENLRLYGGPYTLEEAVDLLNHAQSIKKSGIPNSRLHRLGEAPFKGKVNGIIEALTVYGRIRSQNQKMKIWKALERFECLPVIPWHEGSEETSTVLVDLVGIATLSRKEVIGYASQDSA